MDKRVANADAAIERLRDGMTILMGGFGVCGIPENLIEALRRKGHQGFDGGFKQCRCGQFRHWIAAANTASAENDRELRGRK